MAGKVFFSVTTSLEGFIAPEEGMDEVANWSRPAVGRRSENG
jgi:hypothetical protein